MSRPYPKQTENVEHTRYTVDAVDLTASTIVLVDAAELDLAAGISDLLWQWQYRNRELFTKDELNDVVSRAMTRVWKQV